MDVKQSASLLEMTQGFYQVSLPTASSGVLPSQVETRLHRELDQFDGRFRTGFT